MLGCGRVMRISTTWAVQSDKAYLALLTKWFTGAAAIRHSSRIRPAAEGLCLLPLAGKGRVALARGKAPFGKPSPRQNRQLRWTASPRRWCPWFGLDCRRNQLLRWGTGTQCGRARRGNRPCAHFLAQKERRKHGDLLPHRFRMHRHSVISLGFAFHWE